jgi:hypothetical protein
MQRIQTKECCAVHFAVCEQIATFLDVTENGTYIYHCALNVNQQEKNIFSNPSLHSITRL